MSAIALTDIGNLHGAVEFALAAKRAGIKPIFGAELVLADGHHGQHPLLLYVESARGYRNLNRLLTAKAEMGMQNDEGAVAAQQRRPTKLETLHGFTDGLIAVSPDVRMAELFPGRFYQMASRSHLTPALSPSDAERECPAIACPAIHYATPDDRIKYDIVQSIRTLTLLRQEHPAKRLKGRLHFRTPAEMGEACKPRLEWLAHSLEIAERCNFDMPFGKPQFPAFVPPDGSTPREFLHRLVFDGLRRRYGERAPAMRPQVEQELDIIAAVGYEEYFLVVWNILQDCRADGIEWITRGSAADYQLTDTFKRKGDSLSGPCPLHGGQSPTQFRVSLSKNCWNCFSECKSGGNILDFVARKEDVTIRSRLPKLGLA